jgi:hypothetical protein
VTERVIWCPRRVAAENGEVYIVRAPKREVLGKELEQILGSSEDVEMVF